MPSRPGQPPRISVYWLIPSSVLSAALGAYLATTLSTANLANAGQWLRDFAQSPGAAALAALVAAVIAFSGISKQVAASQASLDHQREAARAAAWWAMFEWASDRAIPARDGDQPLPTSVTIRTLERLLHDATSSIQEAACAGVIDVLAKSVDITATGPSEDELDTGQAEPYESALTALASYVDSSRGTLAASPAAEALVYDNKVLKALIAASWENPTIKLFRNSPSARADAVAEVDGQRIFIEIKSFRSAEGLRQRLVETINRLRASGADSDRYLLITPFPSPLPSDQEAELRAVATQWREPEDTASLIAALRRASALK